MFSPPKILSLFYALAFVGVASCIGGQGPVTSVAGRSLVPVKRSPSLEARDLWRLDVAPKSRAQLGYGICECHYILLSYVGRLTAEW